MGCPTAATARADRLLQLAALVARLCPDHRDPEAFHVHKSEIIAALRRLFPSPLPPVKSLPPMGAG